jgi:hypothetical protein
VLLNEACTWAIPSAMFFLTFFLTRTLAFAMLYCPYLLNLA